MTARPSLPRPTNARNNGIPEGAGFVISEGALPDCWSGRSDARAARPVHTRDEWAASLETALLTDRRMGRGSAPTEAYEASRVNPLHFFWFVPDHAALHPRPRNRGSSLEKSIKLPDSAVVADGPGHHHAEAQRRWTCSVCGWLTSGGDRRAGSAPRCWPGPGQRTAPADRRSAGPPWRPGPAASPDRDRRRTDPRRSTPSAGPRRRMPTRSPPVLSGPPWCAGGGWGPSGWRLPPPPPRWSPPPLVPAARSSAPPSTPLNWRASFSVPSRAMFDQDQPAAHLGGAGPCRPLRRTHRRRRRRRRRPGRLRGRRLPRSRPTTRPGAQPRRPRRVRRPPPTRPLQPLRIRAGGIVIGPADHGLITGLPKRGGIKGEQEGRSVAKVQVTRYEEGLRETRRDRLRGLGDQWRGRPVRQALCFG